MKNTGNPKEVIIDMEISRSQLEKIMAVYRAQRARPAERQEKPKDEIALSAEARLLQDVRNAVKETPEVREEKIRELKEAIAAGEYKVDSREVAERLLQEAALDRLLFDPKEEG